jgi:succinate dehydrogenase / fumarate reductase flavoprotein subunit
MTSVTGLYCLGEANFSDHGANRLGASALMQGLADGYFVIPTTIAPYLVTQTPGSVTTSHPEFQKALEDSKARTSRFLNNKGKRSVDSFHRELGLLVWDKCGMARDHAGLTEALNRIPALREEFWQNVNIPGSGDFTNPELEKAGRVADFMEFAELLCLDARHREESCGGHFRSEHQYPDGEAKRDDENFSYAAAWEYTGNLSQPTLNKEQLTFDEVHLAVRSYK